MSYYCTGLMVIERNWLEVYPYTKWGGNANLPVFRINERFIPTELLLREVGFCCLRSGAREHMSCLALSWKQENKLFNVDKSEERDD